MRRHTHAQIAVQLLSADRHTHMHAHMHTHMHAHTHTCTHILMHACSHARMHAHTHARMLPRTHILTHAHGNAQKTVSAPHLQAAMERCLQATFHARLASWLQQQQHKYQVPILTSPTAHPAAVLLLGRAAASFGALAVVLAVGSVLWCLKALGNKLFRVRVGYAWGVKCGVVWQSGGCT